MSEKPDVTELQGFDALSESDVNDLKDIFNHEVDTRLKKVNIVITGAYFH